MTQDRRDEVEDRHEPVVRDRRRIDPTTGAPREPVPPATGAAPASAAGAAAEAPAAGTEASAPGAETRVAELEQAVGERTADLQRLQAEYVNYRRRVERDREAVRELAMVNVLTNFLPVLDDIGRAREHGELEGGFQKVAEALEATVEKLGLTRFGTVGEPFDPTVHEALLHNYAPDVTEPTCVAILQPGYRFGERVVRPARVAVAEPAEPAAADSTERPDDAPAASEPDGPAADE